MPKKANPLLSLQKPKRKRPLRRRILKVRSFLYLGAIGLVVMISFQLRRTATHLTDTFARSLNPSWQVTIRGDELDDAVTKGIRIMALTNLKGPWPDFGQLAIDLRAKFGLEQVRLTREGLDLLIVEVQPRKAMMRLDSHSVRLLSKDLFVFGKSDSKNANLPLLQGPIFRTPALEHSDNDLSAQPLKDKGLRAGEYAVDLISQLQEKGLLCASLAWDEHRGMTVILATDALEVLFGLPPYKEKVHRLEQMLDERQKGATPLPERIELDFDGKAFIKERNADKGRM